MTLAAPTSRLLAARPVLDTDTAFVAMDGDTVCWVRGKAPIAVDRFVSAVLPHLDGVNLLAELVSDLSAVLEAPSADVARHITHGVERLALLGAISAIDGKLLAPEEDTPGPLDTRELPDGRRVMSVTLEFSTANQADRDMVADLISGERSQLDVIPDDSCVGQKLRVGDPAERFGSEIDGRTLAIRCCHAPTSEVLSERFDRLQEDEGATVVIVTSPHAGSGPPRVYDASGDRVGLPRDGRAAAEIASHLLAEFCRGPDLGEVKVGAMTATNGARSVLLPPGLLGDRAFLRAMARSGIDIVPTRHAVLGSDGVRTEGSLDRHSVRYPVVGLMVPDAPDALSPRTRAVVQLVPPTEVEAARARSSLLERICHLVGGDGLPLVALPEDDAAMAERLRQLLRVA